MGHGQLAHPPMSDARQPTRQVDVEPGGVEVADDVVEFVGRDPVGGDDRAGGAGPLGGGGLVGKYQ